MFVVKSLRMKKQIKKKEALVQIVGRVTKEQRDFILSLRTSETMSWNLREAINLAMQMKNGAKLSISSPRSINERPHKVL